MGDVLNEYIAASSRSAQLGHHPSERPAHRRLLCFVTDMDNGWTHAQQQTGIRTIETELLRHI